MDSDATIAAIYAAANGRRDWPTVLTLIAQELQMWTVQLLGVDKRRGHLIFSTHGGSASPQTALDYYRTYNAIDPRVPLVLQAPVGRWVHCHEHFSEAYVGSSPFYQQFLIPHGGRWVSGARLIDNDDVGFVLAFLRGQGSAPVQACEMALLDRLRFHFTEAMYSVLHLRTTYSELGIARELLGQFTQPVLLIDEARGIWHRNDAAVQVLTDRTLLRDENGFLTCGTRKSDEALTEAIHGLRIGVGAAPARRVVPLDRPGGTTALAFVSAVQPERSMGAFGHTPRVLIVVHDPSAAQDGIDPFVIAECFDLTPAEARVAVSIATGANAKEIAKEQGIALATVRTHVSRVLEKTGAERQADLVRILLNLPFKW